MNKIFILFIVSFFISFNLESASNKDDSTNRDRLTCIETIKKYPYMQLVKRLKKDNDLFIGVLTYNSDWGMYPSYIYVYKPIQLHKNKANIIVINKETCGEISQLIDKYIDFNKPLFINYGKNSIPAIFHVIVVYRNGKTSEIILSQINNRITNKYENNIYTDKPFIFLAKLADMTNTHSMFESIYGFSPISLKNINMKEN